MFLRRLSLFGAAMLLACASASAGTLYSSGTLTNANQIFEEEFTLSAPADVTISTLLASNISDPEDDTTGSFVAGGFDPVVWLFSDENYNGSTIQYGKDDDICIGAGEGPTGPDAACTGQVFDSQVTVSLPAGTYVAVVSDAGDSSEPQYADGQHFYHQPDYQVPGRSYDGTFGFGSDPVETRTGYYQLTISSDAGTLTEVTADTGVVFPNQGFAEVPEPGTSGLLVTGVLLGWVLRRRFKGASLTAQR